MGIAEDIVNLEKHELQSICKNINYIMLIFEKVHIRLAFFKEQCLIFFSIFYEFTTKIFDGIFALKNYNFGNEAISSINKLKPVIFYRKILSIMWMVNS